jgi:mycofactocin precursor
MDHIRTLESPEEAANPESTTDEEEPRILDEIEVEELAIDGICGVY